MPSKTVKKKKNIANVEAGHLLANAQILRQLVGIAVPVHWLARDGQKAAHGLERVLVHVDVELFELLVQVALELLDRGRYCLGGCRRILKHFQNTMEKTAHP